MKSYICLVYNSPGLKNISCMKRRFLGPHGEKSSFIRASEDFCSRYFSSYELLDEYQSKLSVSDNYKIGQLIMSSDYDSRKLAELKDKAWEQVKI